MLFQIYFSLFVLRYLSMCANASDCREKPHCGINEVWDCLCLPRPTCDEPCGGDGPHVCPLDPDGNCVKECICRPGFLRANNGLCTHCTQCTPLDEDDCCDDEVFQNCGTFCPETCASRGESITCTEQCVKGCFCRHGQVRNINGLCVDPDKCPGKGGDGGNKGGDKGCNKGCGGDPNAHPGCGLNCGKTCATYKNPPKVCPIGCIQHGCDCNDGYVKDPNLGKCVKPKDCTPTCKSYEVYKKCGPACPATCNNGGNTTGCPEEPCVAGCFCKDGYVRVNSGKCVKLCDCNKCVTNETYTECGSLCPWDCSNYGDPIGCGALCVKGCFCTKDYYRNKNGDCVLLKDCPPKKCGENEYFSQCGPDCEPYCVDISDDIVCDGKCKYGCFCKEGYFRHNGNNKCVKIKDCNSACPKDEIFKTCGTSCQPTCDDPNPLCDKKCSRNCFCPDGYIREQKGGKCIKVKDCPAGCKGDPNAHLTPCGDVCPATCANGGVRPKFCPAICKINSCACLPGFVLDDNGKCITLKECPPKAPKCKSYEVYKKCGPACPATCNNGGDTTGCPEEPCVAGCFCKDGYVRANSGKCVKLCDCNKCVTNETYTECGSLCPWDCSNYGDPIGCGALCVKGCFCTKDYYRNKNGDCVLLKDCPPTKCDENEYFSQCGPDCEPYCVDISDDIVCDGTCKYGCFCKEGYFRHNGNNKCVKIKDCNSACPKDEIFKPCGTSCQPTCDNRNSPCDKKCSRNCFCPDGYIREQKGGRCIKMKDCPQRCGPGEHIETCPVDCPSDFCPTKDEPPVACSPPHPCNQPKCKCDFNFRKAKNGTCIPTRDCPPFKCDGKNEVFDACPPICPGENCADAKLNGICPFKIGIVLRCDPRCRCAEGFFRDKDRVCIPADSCPDV